MKSNLKKYIPYILVYFVIFIILFLQHNLVHMYFDDFGNASLSYATTVENVVKTNYTFKQLIDENFGTEHYSQLLLDILLNHLIFYHIYL